MSREGALFRATCVVCMPIHLTLARTSPDATSRVSGFFRWVLDSARHLRGLRWVIALRVLPLSSLVSALADAPLSPMPEHLAVHRKRDEYVLRDPST